MNQQQEIISSNDEQQEIQLENKKIKKNSNKNTYKIILNISDCQYVVVTKVAKSLGWKLQSSSESTDWDVLWTDNAVQSETLLRMEQHQKINHFPGMFNLARKNLLGRGLMKMRKQFPQDYNFFPLTWMLPVQYHQLKKYYQSKTKGKTRTFIVKPEALSQGKGIFLTRKLEDIDPNQHCVVQRYLHRPYLIDGLKFDLRVYILLTSLDPLRIYYYRQGLGRFATQSYQVPNKDNIEQTCMHLTNYAINKDNPKFIFNTTQKDMSTGHKRSLTSVMQLLEKDGIDTKNLINKIQEIIVKTIISGLPHLISSYKACQPQNYSNDMCFQLLGFDILLTDKCQPILLQINHTPSFTIDTPLDTYIKTNYIKDSLILLNINQKRRNQIIKNRKDAIQQRIVTGKKMKLTPQEKQKIKQEAINQRDKYQKKHRGNFQRIYPPENQDKLKQYEQFFKFADQCFGILVGGKKQKKCEPQSNISVKQKPKIISNSGRKNCDFVKANMIFPKRIDIKNIHQNNKVFQSNKQLTISEKPQTPQLNYSEKNQQTNQLECQKQSPHKSGIHQKIWLEEEYNQSPTLKQNHNSAGLKYIPKNRNNEVPLHSNLFNFNITNFNINNEKDKTKESEQEKNYKKRGMWKQIKTQPKTISQRQKIPITLNTLLISGIDSNTALSVNNLKKILNQQKYKNRE